MSSPKAFDPTRLPQLLADLQTAYPEVQKVVLDFVSIFAGTPHMQAAQPLKCGPDGGCTDCGECLDAAIQSCVTTLASLVQAKKCHTDATTS